MKQYRIIETPCHPNVWKVVPKWGRNSNATHLFHPTLDMAKEQIEKELKGKLLEILYLEN